ncbi:MAG: peptidylprolyl isomerase [Planctomycetes bacterium]|nr:peptidylprolyl isomerase [Planctomycetota bacterium]
MIPPKGSVQAVVDCPLIKPGAWTFTALYQGTPNPVRSAPAAVTVKPPEAGRELLATLVTSKGNIAVRFFPDDAPNTVISFIRLVRGGFYTNRIFHRVIKGFVIQGGCPFGNGQGGPGYTLPAEFNKRPHVEGVLSMARTSQPDSAGSQFFICLGPQPSLDGKYSVFGEVVQGIEVVRAIGEAETAKPQDRPVTEQKIASMSVEVK